MAFYTVENCGKSLVNQDKMTNRRILVLVNTNHRLNQFILLLYQLPIMFLLKMSVPTVHVSAKSLEDFY